MQMIQGVWIYVWLEWSSFGDFDVWQGKEDSRFLILNNVKEILVIIQICYIKDFGECVRNVKWIVLEIWGRGGGGGVKKVVVEDFLVRGQ